MEQPAGLDRDRGLLESAGLPGALHRQGKMPRLRAALEHHLKYKKEVGAKTELIVQELKRCADELASTDLSMQTIRDMILEQE